MTIATTRPAAAARTALPRLDAAMISAAAQRADAEIHRRFARHDPTDRELRAALWPEGPLTRGLRRLRREHPRGMRAALRATTLVSFLALTAQPLTHLLHIGQ